MKNIVHLDLEGTLIVSYHNPTLIFTEEIKDFISKVQPDEIHLFSHALYTAKEHAYYQKVLQPSIEQALNISIIYSPTVEQIIQQVTQFDGACPARVDEYISVYTKKQSFFQYCKHFEFAANHFLIDDAVGEELHIFKKDLTFLETIPVHKLNSWQPLQFSYAPEKLYKKCKM